MSARSSFFKIAAKAGMVFGALFVVTVLLAAIPAHRAPAFQVVIPQEPAPSPAPARRGSQRDARDEHVRREGQRKGRRKRHDARSSATLTARTCS